ncbi:hypothetical protein D1BOALGB6SA_8055 [Olavius sp. associated proteobacterium Delta 1]|nr:hypothetical protein D1BOALGB6SA_8055 [Olavius sp. associated proteobacterium Delta 1]
MNNHLPDSLDSTIHARNIYIKLIYLFQILVIGRSIWQTQAVLIFRKIANYFF